jgi:hypothetical protein
VNTSLNVGSPIVQTPVQALDALKRAKAMSGLVMIAAEGEAWFVRHETASGPVAIGETANLTVAAGHSAPAVSAAMDGVVVES